MVEVSHRRDPKGTFEWVGLLNHSGQLVTSIHPPIPIHDVKIQLKTKGRVKQIHSLTDGAVLEPKKAASGQVEVVLPRLNVFEIVLVEYDN